MRANVKEECLHSSNNNIIDMAIIIVVGVHRSMAESGYCCFSAIATCVGLQ